MDILDKINLDFERVFFRTRRRMPRAPEPWSAPAGIKREELTSGALKRSVKMSNTMKFLDDGKINTENCYSGALPARGSSASMEQVGFLNFAPEMERTMDLDPLQTDLDWIYEGFEPATKISREIFHRKGRF